MTGMGCQPVTIILCQVTGGCQFLPSILQAVAVLGVRRELHRSNATFGGKKTVLRLTRRLRTGNISLDILMNLMCYTRIQDLLVDQRSTLAPLKQTTSYLHGLRSIQSGP